LIVALLAAVVPMARAIETDATADAIETDVKTDAVVVDEFRLSDSVLATLRSRWVDQLVTKYGVGNWAPLRMELEDEDLALMGLPSKAKLLSQRYPEPTAFDENGNAYPVAKGGNGGGGGKGGGGAGKPTTTTTPAPTPPPSGSPGVAVYAGAGFAGIRPGAWLLLLDDRGIGWCSAAHVFGSPGAYQISTAGHCGKVGDVVTMLGAAGDHTISGVPVPVLLDVGKISKSTGDGGIGNDWALIDVDERYQHLVTPTMAFWAGPVGMFTSTGRVVDVSVFGGRFIDPEVTVTPNAALVQQILHYGHGVVVGTGGTPRSGTSITWNTDSFIWFGAITPGDSGSGSNTLLGDSVGDQREAAGINTHIFVDSNLSKYGLGYLAGTRATKVSGTLANGQLLPYPAPTPVPLP
jgi:hypothetical protein